MKTTKIDFNKSLHRVHTAKRAGKIDLALRELEVMLEHWIDHPRLLLMKGMLLQLSDDGSLAEAKRSLKRASRVDEDSPSPWIELGFFLLCIDDRCSEAEEKFDHAIDLSIRLLLEAIKGKIEAIEDQSLDALAPKKRTELIELERIVHMLAGSHPNGESAKLKDLQEKILRIQKQPSAAAKAERNGKHKV